MTSTKTSELNFCNYSTSLHIGTLSDLFLVLQTTKA